MPFDFKKACKDLYGACAAPSIVQAPKANYAAVRGAGDPNEPHGEYQAALGVLYAVSYALKTSRKRGREIAGFFDYVVPPLEGLWWRPGGASPCAPDSRGAFAACSDKSAFRWLSLIRLPDFVSKPDFDWAVAEAAHKKRIDCSRAEFAALDEGLCAQILHVGSYDDEPATLGKLRAFLAQSGFACDFSETRAHHEIYLSDPRKTPPEKRRTIIRVPVKRAGE